MSEMSATPYVEAWRRRFQESRRQDRKRAQAAEACLTRAVAVLRRHGARRIILFGSLARDCFRERSDIDLAVEGIPAESYTRALADLMLAIDWPVDLKPLEEIEPSFAEHVIRSGKIIYEES